MNQSALFICWGTRFPEVNYNITKFIRKRNVFPDFTEIVAIIRETNEACGSFLSDDKIFQLGESPNGAGETKKHPKIDQKTDLIKNRFFFTRKPRNPTDVKCFPLTAKETFTEVGEELKQIRMRDLRLTIGCHLTDATDADAGDPAAGDEDLRRKLDENQALAKRRIEEVRSFHHFYDQHAFLNSHQLHLWCAQQLEW